MQVSCGNCQLSFDAPEGATGLVCPICRGPLLPKSADGSGPAAKGGPQDWSGGDLDDLIAILSGPALSARVEVLGATRRHRGRRGAPARGRRLGRALRRQVDGRRARQAARGQADALPRRAAPAQPHRRRSRPTRAPESGTLESRALAHLMRYCEDYVITCGIEVWRGNETARVEYKRGEISGVTVGGIDAPERLAEVMQWSSGNYRLIVQPLKLPAVGAEARPGGRRRARAGAGARAVRAGGAPGERDEDHLRHAGRGGRQGARRGRGREGRRCRRGSGTPDGADQRRHARPDAAAPRSRCHGGTSGGGSGAAAAPARRSRGAGDAARRRAQPGPRAGRAPGARQRHQDHLRRAGAGLARAAYTPVTRAAARAACAPRPRRQRRHAAARSIARPARARSSVPAPGSRRRRPPPRPTIRRRRAARYSRLARDRGAEAQRPRRRPMAQKPAAARGARRRSAAVREDQRTKRETPDLDLRRRRLHLRRSSLLGIYQLVGLLAH